jgi:hypothetical protein
VQKVDLPAGRFRPVHDRAGGREVAAATAVEVGPRDLVGRAVRPVDPAGRRIDRDAQRAVGRGGAGIHGAACAGAQVLVSDAVRASVCPVDNVRVCRGRPAKNHNCQGEHQRGNLASCHARTLSVSATTAPAVRRMDESPGQTSPPRRIRPRRDPDRQTAHPHARIRPDPSVCGPGSGGLLLFSCPLGRRYRKGHQADVEPWWT